MTKSSQEVFYEKAVAVLVITVGWVDSSLLHKIMAGLYKDGGDINNYWIYAMLLTTLIPTLVHFALAASALTLWLPQSLRHRIAQ